MAATPIPLAMIEKEKGKGDRGINNPPPKVTLYYSTASPLTMTPFLIFPTSVSSKNFSTASVKRGSLNNFPIEQLPGPTLPPEDPTLKPLLPVLNLILPVLIPTSPEISPTFFHNLLISSFHVLHSLKRCSRLCLPQQHHQH